MPVDSSQFPAKIQIIRVTTVHQTFEIHFPSWPSWRIYYVLLYRITFFTKCCSVRCVVARVWEYVLTQLLLKYSELPKKVIKYIYLRKKCDDLITWKNLRKYMRYIYLINSGDVFSDDLILYGQLSLNMTASWVQTAFFE